MSLAASLGNLSFQLRDASLYKKADQPRVESELC